MELKELTPIQKYVKHFLYFWFYPTYSLTIKPASLSENFDEIIAGKVCPYCHCETQLVKGDVVYPHATTQEPRPAYLDKKYYVCRENRDHYVGTYADNKTALGRLADAELRKWKHRGHQAFDPLWKDGLFKTRQAAYDWLAEKLNLPVKHTHFGMFTVEQCQEAIGVCGVLKGEREK